MTKTVIYHHIAPALQSSYCEQRIHRV